MVGCRRFFMKFYLVLIIAFLYIPIAVLVVLSFNASRSRVVWGGFTLEWYQTLFQNSDVLAALQNTLTIGLGSALIATVIGLMAADAVVFTIHRSGICQHTAGSCDVQYTLRGAEHTAEAAADGCQRI